MLDFYNYLFTPGVTVTAAYLDNKQLYKALNTRSAFGLKPVDVSPQDADYNMGENDDTTVFEVVLIRNEAGSFDTQIQVIGQDGTSQDVSNGFGIGIREHDDVMLAYGYSKFTKLRATIPSGDFLILRLDVNNAKLHHTENRFVTFIGSPLELTVIEVDDTNEFPINPIELSLVNNKGPEFETPGVDGFARFYTYAIQQTNPFTLNKVIDDIPLFAIEGGGPIKADSVGVFANAKGRHYTPNKTYALIVENVGTSDVDFYYQYDFHEY